MKQVSSPGSRIIVALDFPDQDSATDLVGKLNPEQCRLKVGKELFTRAGPDLVARLVEAGFDVFLDLKFHDIPNTVSRACRAAADLGVWMINVHATGGRRMMEAAMEGIDSSPSGRPLLVGVTLLTSLDTEDIREVGLSGTPRENVLRLAALVADCGLDGVVCSAHEASVLREQQGREFVLVTPGIRFSGEGGDDQRRIMTPVAAIRQGAHYLVIGRPVTQADNPPGVLMTVNSEIDALPDAE